MEVQLNHNSTEACSSNDHSLRHRQQQPRQPLNHGMDETSSHPLKATRGHRRMGSSGSTAHKGQHHRRTASSGSTGSMNLHFRRRERRRRRREQAKVTPSGTQVFLPRMILRNMPYNQSNNQCQVINTNKKKSKLFRLLLSDWFHVLLRIKMHYSIVMLLLLWLGMIWFFAVVYVELDHMYEDAACGLGEAPVPISFSAAFAFSLETCTTVGYGLPGDSNAFFESGCHGVKAAIFCQMTWSMLFNAFLFAFFYSQLSKSERRSLQLVFSDKLCINVSREGRVCASVKCYDIDSAFPVVEAHARMYLLDHKLQMNPLRLTNPDDNLGGMLYPSIPQKIIHHIDHHSALAPTRTHLMPLLASSRTNSAVPLRSCDSANAERDEIICPVCGDCFGTYERLAAHVRFNKMIEKQEGYPIQDSHQAFEMPDTSPLTLQEVTDHIEKTMSEIVVVVEAIDPQLSGTFQANQSYKYEDIVFGADHETCTSITPDNKIQVDMRTFHQIRYTNEGKNMLLSFSSSGDSVESDPEQSSSPPPKEQLGHLDSQRKTRFSVGSNNLEQQLSGHIPVRIETAVQDEKKIEESITMESLEV